MITTSKVDRTRRYRATPPRQRPAPANDAPAPPTPILPVLQDAWSRAIARVVARRR